MWKLILSSDGICISIWNAPFSFLILKLATKGNNIYLTIWCTIRSWTIIRGRFIRFYRIVAHKIAPSIKSTVSRFTSGFANWASVMIEISFAAGWMEATNIQNWIDPNIWSSIMRAASVINIATARLLKIY